MRIFRIRRHWILTLVLVVLGVSVWGSWLAETGRATHYADSSSLPFATSTSANIPPIPDLSQVLMTPSRPVGSAPSPSPSMTLPPASQVPGAPHALSLAGVTDPAVFARRVAILVLSYDADTDFAARTDAVMAVAALPPIGSPSELAADLAAFTPIGGAAAHAGSVVFTVRSVVSSAWAAGRIDALGLPSGSFAIDVTGTQVISADPAGRDSIPVAAVVGITGACPPALVQCEIDRIFPNTVEQELGG